MTDKNTDKIQMKLKTLKDFGKDHIDDALLKEIKEEVIKWVKYLRNRDNSWNDKYYDRNLAKAEVLVDFLNISEEDLK